MKYEMDRLLKDVYQQEVKPESILNQKTLRRMQTEEQNDMKKFWTCKKIAVRRYYHVWWSHRGLEQHMRRSTIPASYLFFRGKQRRSGSRQKILGRPMWNRRREAIRNSLHMPIFP